MAVSPRFIRVPDEEIEHEPELEIQRNLKPWRERLAGFAENLRGRYSQETGELECEVK